ncbi:unnamed protein product, partial [Prorocentrum cordatum]
EVALSKAEIDRVLQLATKAGDKALEKTYTAILGHTKSLELAPKEGPLQAQAEVGKHEELQTVLAKQNQPVESFTSQLGRADKEYKKAQVARILLSKLLEGNLSCFDLAECSTLFGLVDPALHGVTEGDRKQAADRQEKMRKGIQDLAKGLFGLAQEVANILRNGHERVKAHPLTRVLALSMFLMLQEGLELRASPTPWLAPSLMLALASGAGAGKGAACGAGGAAAAPAGL